MDLILEVELNKPQFTELGTNENLHFDLVMVDCLHSVMGF